MRNIKRYFKYFMIGVFVLSLIGLFIYVMVYVPKISYPVCIIEAIVFIWWVGKEINDYIKWIKILK